MQEQEPVRTVEPWRRLWRDWLAPHRAMLALSLAMTAVVALASAGYSKLIQLVMTAYQQGTPSVIWWGPLGVIGLSCANGLGQYVKEVTTNRVTNRMEAELRKTMFARLVGTDLARLQTEAPAGLAARFSADIGMIGSSVRSMLGGLSGILTIVATFAVLLTIDWPLTIGVCAVFAFALVPVNRIGRRLRRLSRHTQAQVAAMTSEVAEGLAGIRMARTYRLETPLAENAEGVFERLFGLRTTQVRVQARVAPLMEVLIGIAIAILLFVVGLRMQAGTITIADFTALLTGLGVIAGPARRLGGSVASVQQGGAALDRVFALFDVENTIRDGPETDRARARADPLRGRLLRLPRWPRRPRGHHARRRAGQPRRLRRPLGRRQVDALQPAAAALRPDRRPHPARRPRPALADPRVPARPDRGGRPGVGAALGQRRAQHRLRPPGRRSARRSRRPPAPPPPTASSARCRRATTPR